MPNKPNAKKALRQSIKRKALNDERKLAFRKAIKSTIKATTKEEKLNMVKQAQKALDKASKNGVIKKNTAARKLSRLMKKINSTK